MNHFSISMIGSRRGYSVVEAPCAYFHKIAAKSEREFYRFDVHNRGKQRAPLHLTYKWRTSLERLGTVRKHNSCSTCHIQDVALTHSRTTICPWTPVATTGLTLIIADVSNTARLCLAPGISCSRRDVLRALTLFGSDSSQNIHGGPCSDSRTHRPYLLYKRLGFVEGWCSKVVRPEARMRTTLSASSSETLPTTSYASLYLLRSPDCMISCDAYRLLFLTSSGQVGTVKKGPT